MIPLPYKSIIAAFVVFAGCWALMVVGYVTGHRNGRIEQLQDTVEAYEKRKGIDDEVSSVDRYRVCVDLGGLPDECEQLRGLDETAEGQ